MANAQFDPSGDRFVRGLIRRKINQLVGRAGFTRQDTEDLEQQLLTRVLQSLPKYNPEIGHVNKFITVVVERHVATMLRDKRASKRDHRRISSLNVMVRFEDGSTELSQTIGQRELDDRRCRHPRSEEELARLRLDVTQVIEALPQDLRVLAERLKYETLTEIARDTGIPRSTLADAVARVRQRFEQSGLKFYL